MLLFNKNNFKKLDIKCEIYKKLFFKVTTSKNCTQLLMVGNQNDFPISAKVLPLSSGIHIQTLESFTIDPRSDTKIKLTFHRETLGRYSG